MRDGHDTRRQLHFVLLAAIRGSSFLLIGNAATPLFTLPFPSCSVIRRAGVTVASTVTFVIPLFATLLGGAVVLLAAAGVQGRLRRPRVRRIAA